MNVAVIGGGINGVMSAWALADAGHQVTLFEKNELMSATSMASTKLLHGGLRYLEHGEFGFVREALRERIWWIQQAPQFAHPIELVLPVYKDTKRPVWVIRVGLVAYDLLSGRKSLGRYRWHSRENLVRLCPELRVEGLEGGFTFFDGQMDDRALGLWAAEQAARAGVEIRTHSSVDRISLDGDVVLQDSTLRFDRVVNVAGPWAKRLLDASSIASEMDLDLVRGSHLLLRGKISRGCFLQIPGEERVCFALPYLGNTLLGTTEVRQSLDEPVRCSEQERDYLLRIYNHYLQPSATEADIVGTFAGLRPLIRSNENPSRATREYVIERQRKVVNVFGGKWTTARSLGQRVARATGA